MKVAVLFAMSDSIYKSLPDCEVWDKERDALKYGGGIPIVAHPPCKAWGRYRNLAKPERGEKWLAYWAVIMIRKYGGVLEHPESSLLWKKMNLPHGTNRDEYGGWTLSVDQFWFGHRAKKRTWLYIVGCEPSEIPPLPLNFNAITHKIGHSGNQPNRKRLKEVSKIEREATPKDFALWLIELAKKCKNARFRFTES